MKIIGLTGPAGAGKSTLAAAIVAASPFPVHVVSFAEPMKVALRALLAMAGASPDDIKALMTVSKEQPTEYLGGKSVRHALQTLGTEWGRTCLYPMFWVDTAFRHAKAQGYEHIVIDDVRFANEVEAVSDRMGALVEVFRPGYSFNAAHVSARRPAYTIPVPVIRNDAAPASIALDILNLPAIRGYWV